MWKVGSVVCWFRELINIPELLDPSSQEVISHGDTLLIDTNPRMRLAFEEETRTSTLTVDEISIYIRVSIVYNFVCLQIDRAQVGDGGIFQCQVNIKDDVVPSSPIEVV